MWYFAYDHLASWREMIRFYRVISPRVPSFDRHPALLQNHRLCFPLFSELTGGGVASVVASSGKYVAGALFDLPRVVVEKLDEFYGRSIDWAGREQGVYRRLEVCVRRLDSTVPFDAITHQAIADEGDFYPPSARYIDKLIAAACDLGLSSLWIEQLSSFSHRSSNEAGAGSFRSVADAEEAGTIGS